MTTSPGYRSYSLDLAGEPLVFNQPKTLRPGMIASNGILHAGLLALIREVQEGPAAR